MTACVCFFYLFSECGRASSIRRVDGDKSIEKRGEQYVYGLSWQDPVLLLFGEVRKYQGCVDGEGHL